MPSKKSVIRIGDHVVILDPRPILRIGYDLTVDSIVPEVESDPKVVEFLVSMDLSSSNQSRVIRAIACDRLLRRMRDGSERKIYYGEPDESLGNTKQTVMDKVVRQTGLYSRGYSGGGYYGDDVEPPSLNRIVSHVCLKVWLFAGVGSGEFPSYDRSGFWVTSDQVEKVN